MNFAGLEVSLPDAYPFGCRFSLGPITLILIGHQSHDRLAIGGDHGLLASLNPFQTGTRAYAPISCIPLHPTLCRINIRKA